jgi:hypothetical protein
LFKRKKIRDDFDKIFEEGDETKIKELLNEHPWLLEEVSKEMDDSLREEHQVIAALGIMEDELGEPVPLDEIMFSLKVDFDINKSEEEIFKVLNNATNLGLVKKDSLGWSLTDEGGRICDDFLNKRLENFDF